MMDNRRRSILAMCVGIALFWAALYVYMPILSVYAQSMGASLSLVGLIIASYGVVQLIIRIPLGVASDRLGRRKPFVLAGFMVLVVSCVGFALAPTPGFLLLFRALAGLAACTWVISSVSFVSYFPVHRAAHASGLVNSFGAGGRLLAVSAGGMLAQRWGWTSTFWVGAAMGVLGLVAVALPAEESADRRPLVWRDVVRLGSKPIFLVTSFLGALSVYCSHATSFGFTPIHAAGLGASRAELGWLTTAEVVPYTGLSLAAGRVSTWIGDREAIVVGSLIMAAAMLVTPFISTLGVLGLSRAVYGIGLGLVYPMLMGIVFKAAPLSERGSAMGIFQGVYSLGMFGGPAISGLIAERLGLGAVFLVTGGVALASAVLAFWGLKATAESLPTRSS